MEFVYTLLAGAAPFLLVFVVASVRMNHGLVNVGWGLSFMAAAAVSWWVGDPDRSATVMSGLIFLWGAVLTWQRLRRYWSAAESRRFASWRRRLHPLRYFAVVFFRVYVPQYLLALLVVFPAVWANIYGLHGYTRLAYLGGVVCTFGICYQAVATYQLNRFLRHQKNRTSRRLLTSGLWRFSRHPDFFGEIVFWWGLALIAISNVLDVWMLYAPILVTYALLRVSGVPQSEKFLSRKPGWVRYAHSTPGLVPGIGRTTRGRNPR